jgi:hypothetical protein
MMKSIYLLITSLIICTFSLAQSEVELRIIGGNYEDVASAIVPTPSGGVYALGSTSSHGDGTVRGYVAYFDQYFNYAWSIITPYGSLIENIVDGLIVEGTEDIRILTNRIGENGTYNSTVHYISNLGTSGEIVSTFEIVDEENQTPVALASWQGNTYAFGDTEGDCWLINLDDELAVSEGDYNVWGHPLMSETVSAARVRNDSLYVVGTSVEDGVEQASVWVWGADGNTIWANIGPDEEAYGDNYSNDIAPFEGGATLLYSYQRESDPIGNGIIRFDEGNGDPNGIVNTAGPWFVEGRRMIHYNDILLKLTTRDLNSGTGTDILLTRQGNNGDYINATSFGTNFNETAVDFEIGDDGTIWILGTTYGYLNGSSSICIYRLSTYDLVGSIEPEDISLGITNDPMLFQSVGVEEENVDLLLFPNPASSATRLSKPANWIMYSTRGRVCSRGFGDFIDLSGLRNGFYFVKAELSNNTVVLPVRVVN